MSYRFLNLFIVVLLLSSGIVKDVLACPSMVRSLSAFEQYLRPEPDWDLAQNPEKGSFHFLSVLDEGEQGPHGLFREWIEKAFSEPADAAVKERLLSLLGEESDWKNDGWNRVKDRSWLKHGAKKTYAMLRAFATEFNNKLIREGKFKDADSIHVRKLAYKEQAQNLRKLIYADAPHLAVFPASVIHAAQANLPKAVSLQLTTAWRRSYGTLRLLQSFVHKGFEGDDRARILEALGPDSAWGSQDGNNRLTNRYASEPMERFLRGLTIVAANLKQKLVREGKPDAAASIDLEKLHELDQFKNLVRIIDPSLLKKFPIDGERLKVAKEKVFPIFVSVHFGWTHSFGPYNFFDKFITHSFEGADLEFLKKVLGPKENWRADDGASRMDVNSSASLRIANMTEAIGEVLKNKKIKEVNATQAETIHLEKILLDPDELRNILKITLYPDYKHAPVQETYLFAARDGSFRQFRHYQKNFSTDYGPYRLFKRWIENFFTGQEREDLLKFLGEQSDWWKNDGSRMFEAKKWETSANRTYRVLEILAERTKAKLEREGRGSEAVKIRPDQIYDPQILTSLASVLERKSD